MRRSEESLQRSLVAQLRARMPEPWLVWHTPNQRQSKTQAGILKAMGVLAGVPDLLVVGPHKLGEPNPDGWQKIIKHGPHLIAIECKAPKGRLSPAQRDVIAKLGQCGVPTLIATDLDETLKALTNLGVPLRGRAM